MMMMTPIDRALLVSEWAGRTYTGQPACPSCGCAQSGGQHGPGCVHDEALSMREYPTQSERDRARSQLAESNAPTIPPPAPAATDTK